MIDINTYDPCPECDYRIKFGRCPCNKKSGCPVRETILTLRTQKSSVDRIPTEFFIDVLRRRGWSGELKQEAKVKI